MHDTAMAEPPSSPPSGDTTAEEALSWYKAQYEQLEHELAEFRESSRELEAELEKDLDAADKRERSLREKAEAAEYEVEEWKRKYKESKAEANAAQNVLEKEITTLRDTNRTQQLKLRDIEVANDDFERQARNTTSSLEDLESKYNVAIERGVLLEEEIKMGEQERETLRVDAQRLREELSDLKIEVDILQDKLKKQEARHLSTISTDISVPESPTFDNSPNSPNSTASSPLITTPPEMKALSSTDTLPELQEPPSPPMSDASATMPRPALMRTPVPGMRKSRLPSLDSSITPRPKAFSSSLSSTSSASRPLGTRVPTVTGATIRTPVSRAGAGSRTGNRPAYKLPASNSLSHIRSLTAQMQRLEARVQSARSKLPAPIGIGITPPRVSPRSSGVGATPMIPSSVTVRSRKRTTGSTTSSITSGATGDDSAFSTPYSSSIQGRQSRAATGTGIPAGKHMPRLSTSGVGRLSFGPLPNRDGGHGAESRPSSRASATSYARPASRTDMRDMLPPRPMSRTSFSGTRTPLVRPRSSLGGSLHAHGHSTSINDLPEDEVDTSDYHTPSRRGTYSRYDMDNTLSSISSLSSIPTPSGIPLPGGMRRQSGGSTVGSTIGIPVPMSRRASTSMK